MGLKKSIFSPEGDAHIYDVEGIKISTINCGLKKSGKDDLLLIQMPHQSSVAGVFTTSSTAAAPVDWCRKILPNAKASALVVHSGNANAFTGLPGYQMVEELAKKISDLIVTRPEEIFVAATGIIGRVVPKEMIFNMLPKMINEASENSWKNAAKTIMTTDTFYKMSSRRVVVDGKPVSITGIAKGSGMIMPNMATMLAFVFTDLELPSHVLQTMLSISTEHTFNCITVDSDTSTNDTVLLFSSNKKKILPPIQSHTDERLKNYKLAFNEVMQDLAISIVKDGEGISKLISVKTTGAESYESAKIIAFSIANSPLVKTAIAGEDANWGRIIMAIGKSNQRISKHKISVKIGPYLLAEHGEPTSYNNSLKIKEYMKGKNIEIMVDVGVGDGGALVWTSDLTHEYIRINAEYTT